MAAQVAGTSTLTTGSRPTRPCVSQTTLTPQEPQDRKLLALSTGARVSPVFGHTDSPTAPTPTSRRSLDNPSMSPLPLATALSRATQAVLSPRPQVALLRSITPSSLSVTVLRTESSTTLSATHGAARGVRVVTFAFRPALAPVSAVLTRTSTTLLSE